MPSTMRYQFTYTELDTGEHTKDLGEHITQDQSAYAAIAAFIKEKPSRRLVSGSVKYVVHRTWSRKDPPGIPVTIAA